MVAFLKYVWILLVILILASPALAQHDLNHDGRVNNVDVSLLRSWITNGDQNGDGVLDETDVALLESVADEGNTHQEINKVARASGRQLYAYLQEGVVADVWWDLSEHHRERIAGMVIRYWGLDVATSYKWYCEDVNGILQWRERGADCSVNAVVRVAAIGSQNVCTCGEYYYADDSWNDFCGLSFGLPCYIAHVDTIGHALAAIQVGDNFNDFDSWIFFQYRDANIRVGNWQMPRGSTVEIFEVTSPLHCGGYMDYETLVSWEV